MKKISINLFAVCIALCIGLAINSACGDTLSENGAIESPQNVEDLKRLVLTLQSEIDKLQSDFSKLSNDLKNTQTKVQELESQNKELQNLIKGEEDSGESTSISSGMFCVDGLWYLPTGYPCGRVKTSSGVSKITYFNTGEEVVKENSVPVLYEYDEHGRVSRLNYDYSEQGYYYYNYDYKYNGKIVTNIIEYKTDDVKYSSVTETEYY